MSRIINVNDSRTYGCDFKFEFNGPWVHEGGYPTRFHDGDEHWITSDQFGDNYPSFSLKFTGTKAVVYGHTTSTGALCSVSLDGNEIGKCDFYTPGRIEKAELYRVDNLEDCAHTLTFTMLEGSNPNASPKHEAAVDYAEIECSDRAFEPDEIRVSSSSLYLECGMSTSVTAELYPDYADNKEIVFVSSDTSIAEVTSDGKVTARAVGETIITVKAVGTALEAKVSIECAEKGENLSVTVADNGYHTNPGDYLTVLKRFNESITLTSSSTCFANDRALIKLDFLTRSEKVNSVSVKFGDLTSVDGNKANVSADIRFVTPTLAHDTGKYVPDCINLRGSADFEPCSIHTAFVIVDIPSDCKAGIYCSDITVSADGLADIIIPAKIEVLPYALPETHDNPFNLELWEYPYSAERYYSGKSTADYFGSDIKALPFIHLTGEYDTALRSQLEIYAKAGGKAITVTCVEDPWNSQTYDPYPSMIKWHRHSDGSFTFDYSDFDRWVALNFECGIDRQIKTFSIACWGNRVTYINDDSTVSCESLTPGSERWKEFWGAFLRDYMAHTLERGWFDITYMSMDERDPADIEALLDLNQSIKTPDGRYFKTSLAVFRFDAEYLFDRIDDLSLALYMDGAKVTEIARKRRAAGKLTSLYTCGPACSALSNEPYESEYSMMFCAMRETDGFLRWALDAFNADPIASSEHRLFAAGDLYLIYPDNKGCCCEAHSSHRFEKIAEGIRNVEKFKVLASKHPEYADEINALLLSFGHDSDIRSDISRVMDKLYEIARR